MILQSLVNQAKRKAIHPRPGLTASIPSQDLVWLNMPISEMISEDASIDENGKVTGTLTYIEDFEDFSSKPEEQEGYYLPVMLNTEDGTTMTIKKNGVAREDKTDIPYDSELILRSTSGDTWTIEVNGDRSITLDLSDVEFE